MSKLRINRTQESGKYADNKEEERRTHDEKREEEKLNVSIHPSKPRVHILPKYPPWELCHLHIPFL